MNEKKIAIIMCSNSTDYENECRFYISRMNIPDGYELETVVIHDAKCMTEGYNRAMKLTDAKYKIYIHHDTFILNSDILSRLISIFEDKSIGMVGMVGSVELSEDSVMWDDARVGALYSSNCLVSREVFFDMRMQDEYTEVQVVDGFFMATAIDIPWREDLFKGWDFYDISMGFEMRKRGFKVVVPTQSEPWCIHDDGIMNLKDYDKNRHIFVREYR